MKTARHTALDTTLGAFFTLFVFSSTFSIALSQTALGVSLLLFLILLFRKRYNPFGGPLKTLYIVMALYVAWMIVSSLAGATPWRSFIMEKEDWLFFTVPIAVYVLSRPDYRDRIGIALAVGMIMMSIYGVLQFYTGFHWPRPDIPTPTPSGHYYIEGTFSHHLTYGNYFAIAALFLLGWALLDDGRPWKSIRGLALIAAVMGLLVTVMSLARTATAALPLALIVLAALKSRRWLAGMIGIVAVASVLSLVFVPSVGHRFERALTQDFAGDNQAARTFIWSKSLAIVAENPVFGVGHGNFAPAYEQQNDPDKGESRVWSHAHNDLLTIAASNGIPGALLFIGLWVTVIWLLLRGWYRFRGDPSNRSWIGASIVASITFGVCSLTEATFADEEVRQLLMFVWAGGLWPLVAAAKSPGPTAPEAASPTDHRTTSDV